MRLVKSGGRAMTAGALGLALAGAASLPAQETATGLVFHDLNGNGIHDAGEPPIPGVMVSNGHDVALTDEEGRYELSIEGDTVIFVSKPAGYAIEVDEFNTPQFYYIHRPEGSPPGHPEIPARLLFDKIEPTGALPESIDFPLRAMDEPEDYRVILFADPQPRNREELDFVVRTAITEAKESAGADIGITLGDILFDDLSLFDDYIKATAKLGIPFYGVIGNHDLNFDAEEDFHAGETYISHYGPRTYSFTVGKVHYVMMDNIFWNGYDEGRSGNYTERFREQDLEWLARNIENVPDDHLIVLGTHAPLWASNRGDSGRLSGNMDKLFEVLHDRHRVLAVNGHTHYNNHRTFGPEDGWHGEGHFHHINIVTVSGAWWSGPRDSMGIPTTEQRDGSPHGYMLLDIRGDEYVPHYRALRKSPNTQMRIYPPVLHEKGPDKLIVNIFDGMSDGGEATVRINGGEPRALEFAPQTDPVAVKLYTEDSPEVRSWVNPVTSHHIWEATLGEGELASGTNLIEVHYSDRLGREFSDSLIFLND